LVKKLTYEKVIQQVEDLDNFDKYILKYFFDGIKNSLKYEIVSMFLNYKYLNIQ
jgi:hypothetical protein